MSNGANDFHHVEIHTKTPEVILDLFQRVYHFHLIGQRQIVNYSQWFLRSYQCRLIISSVGHSSVNESMDSNSDHYDILTSILSQPTTADYVLNRDTAFNVALEVKSVQTILKQNPDLQVQKNCFDPFLPSRVFH